jgi:TRAP-type uncharacterized transport system fused permease subunit
MLIVAPGFTWYEFVLATAGCIVGIVFLSSAFSGYLLVPTKLYERWLSGIGAILLIAPSLGPTIVGLGIVTPVVIRHVVAWRAQRPSAAMAA